MASNLFTPKKVFLFSALGTYCGYRLYYKYTMPEIYDYKFDASRNVSRLTGKVANVTIPKSLRQFIYTKFGAAYGVNLEEIEEADITTFSTFLEFFTRKIKPRPIDADPKSVVSPADCKVLTFSEVTSDNVVIVKNVAYNLGELLTGIPNYPLSSETLQNMKRSKDSKLYHCILYLAPGDYHRFHSPANLLVKQRSYIFGTLLPVKREYALTGKMKYDKNERVTVLGDWMGGLMSMVFVGALNVGSVELNFDPELKTNLAPSSPFSPTIVKTFNNPGKTADKFEGFENLKAVSNGIQIEKGAEIGRFNLGSSIVLFFEAPKDFQFTIKEGQDIKYGEVIGK